MISGNPDSVIFVREELLLICVHNVLVCYRSLKFIEDYIVNEVLTEYGNTHTTTSVSSLQTTLYRHEARSVDKNFYLIIAHAGPHIFK